MFRQNQVFIITAISLLVLVGCSNSEKSSTPQSSSAASPAAETTASPGKGNFKGLLSVVTNTKTAVAAGNFTKAKAEFGKFEVFWSQVEDGVKAKSSNSYKAIEDKADEIKSGLNTSSPNKQKLLAALDSLNKNITSVSKL